jgi:hypothetical protein
MQISDLLAKLSTEPQKNPYISVSLNNDSPLSYTLIPRLHPTIVV